MGNAKRQKLHWLGGIESPKRRYPVNFPACMGGDLARENEGIGTNHIAAVTCVSCTALIQKHLLCEVSTCPEIRAGMGFCPRHLVDYLQEVALFPNDTDATIRPTFIWKAERRDMDARKGAA